MVPPLSIAAFTYNTRLVPKFSYKAQLVSPHSSLASDEKKLVCNILKAPYNSFPPCLVHYGKSCGFYQLSSIQVQSASAAIRPAWSTVTNWHFWLQFLEASSSDAHSSFTRSTLSPSFWDSTPCAVNLHNASVGCAFESTWDLGSCIAAVKNDFNDPAIPFGFKTKIQKHLSAVIKPVAFPNTIYYDLHPKAAKQQILRSPTDISSIISSLSSHPFLLSVTFIKVLTNALCTTSRIKNYATFSCFACGNYRDDLYRFSRCPHISFV